MVGWVGLELGLQLRFLSAFLTTETREGPSNRHSVSSSSMPSQPSKHSDVLLLIRMQTIQTQKMRTRTWECVESFETDGAEEVSTSRRWDWGETDGLVPGRGQHISLGPGLGWKNSSYRQRVQKWSKKVVISSVKSSFQTPSTTTTRTHLTQLCQLRLSTNATECSWHNWRSFFAKNSHSFDYLVQTEEFFMEEHTRVDINWKAKQ